MKFNILLLSTSLILASCSSKDDLVEDQSNEDVVDQIETVIQLDEREDVNNRVMDHYFSNFSEFPSEKGRIESNKENNIYWLRANWYRVRGEAFFSADDLIYAYYDSDSNQIEIANILFEGATIQGIPLEEDLYISWIYDFKNDELQDLVQVNIEDEPQDLIQFTEEDWADLSNGYKENLLQMLK